MLIACLQTNLRFKKARHHQVLFSLVVWETAPYYPTSQYPRQMAYSSSSAAVDYRGSSSPAFPSPQRIPDRASRGLVSSTCPAALRTKFIPFRSFKIRPLRALCFSALIPYAYRSRMGSHSRPHGLLRYLTNELVFGILVKRYRLGSR